MRGDLISRSALLAEYEWLKSQVNQGSVPEIEEHIQRIWNAPTVDAVEVVRCKNCKYRKDGWCGHKVWIGGYVEDDDFCSYGERRTDG